MADEIAHLLEEGVVAAAADVDTCLLLGAGFPFFLGGITQAPGSDGRLRARARPSARRDPRCRPGLKPNPRGSADHHLHACFGYAVRATLVPRTSSACHS